MSNALPVLATAQSLSVHQQKEWGEIISGWETKNRYEVRGGDGVPMLYAGEVGGGIGGFLARSFLKNKRPFTIELRDSAGQLALRVRRPWTWFFAKVELTDGAGQAVGTIRQRWAFFARRYSVHGPGGEELAQLHGPFFRPWTFKILHGQQQVGQISKKWSGMLKEAFTDADSFGVELGAAMNPQQRLLALGATFLIDFVHFENA